MPMWAADKMQWQVQWSVSVLQLQTMTGDASVQETTCGMPACAAAMTQDASVNQCLGNTLPNTRCACCNMLQHAGQACSSSRQELTCDVCCSRAGGDIHGCLDVAVSLVVHSLQLVAQDDRHCAHTLLDHPAALCDVRYQLEHGLPRLGPAMQEPVQSEVKRLPVADVVWAPIARALVLTRRTTA